LAWFINYKGESMENKPIFGRVVDESDPSFSFELKMRVKFKVSGKTVDQTIVLRSSQEIELIEVLGKLVINDKLLTESKSEELVNSKPTIEEVIKPFTPIPGFYESCFMCKHCFNDRIVCLSCKFESNKIYASSSDRREAYNHSKVDHVLISNYILR
jgi:hypothetical protein